MVRSRENVARSRCLDEPRAGRRPTMKDVAALAGVSLATVSRVVNGNGDVRPDLAARVQDAVERARLPARSDGEHAAAQPTARRRASGSSSRTSRTRSSRPCTAGSRTSPARAACSRSPAPPTRTRARARARRGVRRPRRRRPGRSCRAAATRATCSASSELGTALVFVDRPPRFIDADAVVTDNAGGARTAVEHLLAAGHRRIALPRRPAGGLHRRRAPARLPRGARGAPASPRTRRSSASELVDSDAAAAAAARAADGAPTRRPRCSPART